MKINSIIKKLASQGLQHQLDQTQEECAELIVAISKFRRKKGDVNTTKNLLEEIADVYIMILQLELFFKNENLKDLIEEKLARSEERLANGTI